MSKKFIVIVLDGFGIGAMEDVLFSRKDDIGANTALHILESRNLSIPTLERLGLINALSTSINGYKKSNECLYGVSDLAHFGADTFWGHQEILGTKPKKPLVSPFSESIDAIEKSLIDKGFDVERYRVGLAPLVLIVNKAIVVGDNLETDLGNNCNLTAAFDLEPFERVVEVGRVVRSIVKHSRVIAFGAPNLSFDTILKAYDSKENIYAGVHSTTSGVYKDGYQVQHMGYGVDYKTQIPYKLSLIGIKTTLIGKVADIAENHFGNSISCVETDGVFDLLYDAIKVDYDQFICANVQETDLAGHLENTELYASRVELSDTKIAKLINLMNSDDVLLVMADHGNDPTIKHSRHTRERVPLLIYSKNMNLGFIGERSTLSDVAASVADFFGSEQTESGTSFLDKIFK